MVVLEFGQVVNVFVDDDPKIVGLVVRGHVVLAECLGHGDVAKQTKGQICGMLETSLWGRITWGRGETGREGEKRFDIRMIQGIADLGCKKRRWIPLISVKGPKGGRTSQVRRCLRQQERQIPR